MIEEIGLNDIHQACGHRYLLDKSIKNQLIICYPSQEDYISRVSEFVYELNRKMKNIKILICVFDKNTFTDSTMFPYLYIFKNGLCTKTIKDNCFVIGWKLRILLQLREHFLLQKR
jgi:hypothetical protein